MAYGIISRRQLPGLRLLAGLVLLYGVLASAHSANGQVSAGPQQTKIYFTQNGASNHMLVHAELNNRPITMVFDTGAACTIVGKNHLEQLGIKPPRGACVKGYGIGSPQGVPMWPMRVNVRVGQLSKANCLVYVQDNLSGNPLLGQSFFGDYTYSIDGGASCIVLRRKGVNTNTTSVPSQNYLVPFVREGNELLVTMRINGHTCPMYLDTGAQTNVISTRDLQTLNIPVPDDAKTVFLSGIAGRTTGKLISITRVQLGPVDKSDVSAIVPDQYVIRHSLVGQSFLQGWETQIDNAHNQILFTRR